MLIQFTADAYVKDTLRFLMTREVAHLQMFEASRGTIEPNFPPCILQSDPKHSSTYFNMLNGEQYRRPWNQGESTQLGETWKYVKDQQKYVHETNGLIDRKPERTTRTDKTVVEHTDALTKESNEEITSSMPPADLAWSDYDTEKHQGKKEKSLKNNSRQQPSNFYVAAAF